MSNAVTLERTRVTLVRHGLAVMLIGLIGGFAWTFALLGEVRISPIPFAFFDSFPGDPARWRAVHVGCLLNGIMAVALAAVLHLFAPTDRQLAIVKNGVLFAIWANTVFYFASLVSPNRSLSMGDNALGAGNLAGAIGYTVALIGAFALIVAVISLMRAAARDDS